MIGEFLLLYVKLRLACKKQLASQKGGSHFYTPLKGTDFPLWNGRPAIDPNLRVQALVGPGERGGGTNLSGWFIHFRKIRSGGGGGGNEKGVQIKRDRTLWKLLTSL